MNSEDPQDTNSYRHWLGTSSEHFLVDRSISSPPSFSKKTIYLFDVSSVKIERHIKVKGAASPDDPHLRKYWQTREEQRKARLRQRKVTKARHKTESDA